MKKTVRFAVSLDHHLLDDFDSVLVQKKYETRSEAIRDLIRDHLVMEGWDAKKETVGTISLVYNHHVHALTEKLTSIQHHFHKHILSAMHVHLDHDHCIEVLVVRGKGQEVRTIADSLISTKGVKHGKLTMTTTGKELA